MSKDGDILRDTFDEVSEESLQAGSHSRHRLEPSSAKSVVGNRAASVVSLSDDDSTVHMEDSSGASTPKSRRRSFFRSNETSIQLHHLYGRQQTVADKVLPTITEEELIDKEPKQLVSTFKGVYVPTCEMMWGVLIFVRFGWVVGEAGVGLALLAAVLSALTVTLTISSMSAIATNGVAKGGTYYLLTKALGPALGGSISIIYYIGVTILSTVELAGFAEALINVFHQTGATFTGSAYWDQVIIASLALVAMVSLAFIGVRFVQTIGIFFMMALLIAFLSCFADLFAAPQSGAAQITGVTGLHTATLRDNLQPVDGFGQTSFSSIMALVFPCFIGLMSGVNQASSLQDPYKSIPRGAFGAVGTSFCLYTLIFIFLGAVAQRTALTTQRLLLVDLSWPTKWAGICGCILVGFGSGLQCLVVSPRILHAISKGKIVPALGRLRLDSLWRGEPRKALLISYLVAAPFVFMKDLDTLATIVTMCFLQCYAFTNMACFIFSILQVPSWRPKYKYYHWSTACLGFLLCVVLMFLINYIAAIVSLFASALLALYIQWAHDEKDWGEGFKGLQVHFALNGLLSVEMEERRELKKQQGDPDYEKVSRIWRPHYLCFVEIENDEIVQMRMLSLLRQLKASRGLCIVASVIIDTTGVATADAAGSGAAPAAHVTYDQLARVLLIRKMTIQEAMANENLHGFASVITARSDLDGINATLQSAGLSSLSPNTVLACWPDNWREQPSVGFQVVDLLKRARALRKSAVFVKGIAAFPARKEFMLGNIDIWWVVHEGGLLMLLAVLLKKSKTWKRCKLRIFTVAELTDNSVLIENQIRAYLYELRIKAEVKVIEMQTNQFAYFTNEWTVLKQDRMPTPRDDKEHFFPSFIDELKGVRHASRAERAAARELGLSSSIIQQVGPSSGTTVNLQKAILEHSEASALVIMNTPVPSPDHVKTPLEYMELIEFLTEKLGRVLLVSGCGQEVINID